MIKHESRNWWGVRIFWPLLGGAWGAWVVYQGLSRPLPQLHGDTFAGIIAWGFIGFFFLIGLTAGAVSATLTGGLAEWFLRSLRVAIVPALCVASLVSALSLWQATNFVLTKYPDLRADSAKQQQRSRPVRVLTPEERGTYQNPCLGPPPVEAKERALWDAECR